MVFFPGVFSRSATPSRLVLPGTILASFLTSDCLPFLVITWALVLLVFFVMTIVAGEAACPVDNMFLTIFFGVLAPFTGFDFLRTLETADTVALETFTFFGVLPRFFFTISVQSVVFFTDLASLGVLPNFFTILFGVLDDLTDLSVLGVFKGMLVFGVSNFGVLAVGVANISGVSIGVEKPGVFAGVLAGVVARIESFGVFILGVRPLAGVSTIGVLGDLAAGVLGLGVATFAGVLGLDVSALAGVLD